MLGSRPLQSYRAEKPLRTCVACKDQIADGAIFYLLFDDTDSHESIGMHRECAKWVLEQMVLRREKRGGGAE